MSSETWLEDIMDKLLKPSLTMGVHGRNTF